MAIIFEKRFAPFFWTQFLSAFTDNAFKQALVLMITFRATMSEAETGQLIATASGLFILPYFLFSPIAGQISDKYEKAGIMRRVKFLEIVIMLLAALGFVLAGAGFGWADTYLIGILFLMGTQSTFFGPVKYSIIPQHLREDELMEGTALVESGTFVAILTGTIVGGILILQSVYFAGGALIVFSVAGWLASRKIPFAAPANPDIQIRWNWLSEYGNLYRITKQNNSVFLSIIGISWFWFLGAMVMAQLPNFVKLFVHGDESLYIMFLSLFTLSIAAGAVLTDLLSDTSIELGMVPFGLAGLSLFSLDIGLIDYSQLPDDIVTAATALGGSANLIIYRTMLDVCGMGIASSFFIVPLYALLQHRTALETRSQVIAANNVAGALFMLGSAVIVSVLYAREISTPQLFIVLAALNVGTSLYLLASHPEFILRFLIWLLGLTRYKVRYVGRARIPGEGACLLVANPMGWLDWPLITAASERPVRFVHETSKPNSLGSAVLTKWFGAILMADDGSAEASTAAATSIRRALEAGEVVCVFSGSKNAGSATGPLLHEHLAQVLEDATVLGVPIALHELSGQGQTNRGPSGTTTSLRRHVEVQVGEGQPNLACSSELVMTAQQLLANS